MYCESCGSFIPDGNAYCSNCGAPGPGSQAGAAPTPAVRPAPLPQYQQPVYQQPVYQQPVYQQPVYQQPVYQQPVVVNAVPRERVRINGAATAGLILGILSMLFCWFPFYNSILDLLALVFSIIGIARSKTSGKGRAIAGLCLASLSTFISILIYLGAFAEYMDNI